MLSQRFLKRFFGATGLACRDDVFAEGERIRIMIGRQDSLRVQTATYPRIRDAEFQVFSQGGEDGIIQYLLGKVPIGNAFFVEFGVQDYRESNTRFLVSNDEWTGLLIDGGETHQRFVRDSGLGWRTGLKATTAFITAENINQLLLTGGASGDIGLLSIDIDGNDYWVLEAIKVIAPRIMIVEYNSTFGPDFAVTIPYDPQFQRTAAHFSNLYYGASLRAVCSLAERKGYIFVGANKAGNNAFFVRADVAGSIRAAKPEEEFVSTRFLESRDPSGRLSLLATHADRRRAIASMPLINVSDGSSATVDQLYSETR